jgi:transposase
VSERDDAEAPRLVTPVRNQLQLQPTDLEGLVPDDHPVRSIWAFVESMDLGEFYAAIRSRGSSPGAPATDPRVLLALWIFANSEAVGSARLLARLCERDAPYRWICGGVPVNHHTLSDFRTEHGPKLDNLLTQMLASLMKHGAIKLRRVAQDGLKIRASAGAKSFRRKQTLASCFREAKDQVTSLKRELQDDGSASTRRERAARERAATERQARIKAALKEMPLVEKQRVERAKRNAKAAARAGEVRVSTTDPECRVMKMADGGYRPAYNAQLATDSSGFVVGVAVTNHGTDQPNLVPMLDEIERRTGRLPTQYLVDGGFVSASNVEVVSERGLEVFGPVPKPKNEKVDRYAPKPTDSPLVAKWRRRMKTKRGKKIYRDRAALAERTNADVRGHRGLDRLNVRGLPKVTAVVLLAALTYNVLRAISAGLVG